LAVDLEGSNDLLSLVRRNPVNQLHGTFVVGGRVPRRVNRIDAIRIEHLWVGLQQGPQYDSLIKHLEIKVPPMTSRNSADQIASATGSAAQKALRCNG
jgi:hypothetical protein